MFFWTWSNFKRKVNQNWYIGNANHKCNCNYVALFQVVGAQTNLQHFFQINEAGHTEAKTVVFLIMFLEYYLI